MKGRWEVCRIYEIVLLTWEAPRSHCRICWIGESSGADPCCPWWRWHRRRQTLQKLSWNSRRRWLVKEEGRGRRREGSRMFSFLAFYFVGDLLALSEGSTILRHFQWPSENHYFLSKSMVNLDVAGRRGKYFQLCEYSFHWFKALLVQKKQSNLLYPPPFQNCRTLCGTMDRSQGLGRPCSRARFLLFQSVPACWYGRALRRAPWTSARDVKWKGVEGDSHNLTYIIIQVDEVDSLKLWREGHSVQIALQCDHRVVAPVKFACSGVAIIWLVFVWDRCQRRWCGGLSGWDRQDGWRRLWRNRHALDHHQGSKSQRSTFQEPEGWCI